MPAPDTQSSSPGYALVCPCGWRETLTHGFRGLTVECPKCGQNHKLPMVGDAAAQVLTPQELAWVNRVTGREGLEGAPAGALDVARSLQSVLGLALVGALFLSLGGLVLLFSYWTLGISLGGVGVSWVLGVLIARAGARAGAPAAADSSTRAAEASK